MCSTKYTLCNLAWIYKQSHALALCERTELNNEAKVDKKGTSGRTRLLTVRAPEIIMNLHNIGGRKKIGEGITEELEYEPGKLFVNRYVRPKYVIADNNSIIIAPMIDRPLPKAIVGPGLLAQIIIDKYVDHLPLYRQEQRFKRDRVNIPYSTIGDWIKNGCALLDPLGEARKKSLSAASIYMRETP